MRTGVDEAVRKTGLKEHNMKKITVLFGNYGSGKTELSLNMVLEIKKQYENVTLVDLDIVNPYFRSSEHRAMLEEKGV